MPKANNEPPQIIPGGSSKGKRKSNISLPERALPLEVTPNISRRNTITEEQVSRPRKKPKPPSTPTIPEDYVQTEQTTAFTITNETKKLNRNSSDASKKSTASGKNVKVPYTYENKAFEGNQPKLVESRNNSIRTGSRAPSVQSLEIYREQYCCFAKRTKCERGLLVTVTILAVIIIVLVVVIIILARHSKDSIFR